MDTLLRTEVFTEKEQKEIDKAIAKLRGERNYGNKPAFYHDCILIGCRSILGETSKPTKA